MSLFKPTLKTPGADRPSVLINLRLVDKLGVPVDASLAWLTLKAMFKDHPHLDVFQATISPDKDSDETP